MPGLVFAIGAVLVVGVIVLALKTIKKVLKLIISGILILILVLLFAFNSIFSNDAKADSPGNDIQPAAICFLQ